MNHETNRQTSAGRSFIGCLLGACLALTLLLLLLCGGAYFAYRTINSFENRRDQLCVRSEVEVEQARLEYSPGFDYIIWSKFTVRADSMDEVFDPSRVDPAEFREGFEINIPGMMNPWWDVEDHELSGAEFQVSEDEFMRVGYVDNGDGTFTVYIYLFEV